MEFATYFQFLIALVVVLALIATAAWLARRAGLGGAIAPRRGPDRRLTVVEAAGIDGKRRIVLVRRDDTEHLILLGGGTDVVIERGIAAPKAAPGTIDDDRKAET